MKTIIAVILTLCLVASVASATPDIKQQVLFSNWSAASAAVKTTSAINVTYFRGKTLQVSGVTLTSSPTTVAYKNMSGTLLAQCAPTSTGPWSTCVANEYGQTGVSKTTNGSMTWTDFTSYIRFQWTSGTVGGKLKAWLNISD